MNAPKNNPSASNKPTNKPTAAPGDDRRGFLTRAVAVVIGAVVTLTPLGAGLVTFFDPLLRRTKRKDEPIRVASLDALPKAGEVYRFPVIDERVDKWNRYPKAPIGAVYLVRDEANKVKAYSAICTHLGCFVDFRDGQFKCPCHNSTWTVKGERINPESCPAPRDLDELEVPPLKDRDIYVVYKRYRQGIAAKVEEA